MWDPSVLVWMLEKKESPMMISRTRLLAHGVDAAGRMDRQRFSSTVLCHLAAHWNDSEQVYA